MKGGCWLQVDQTLTTGMCITLPSLSNNATLAEAACQTPPVTPATTCTVSCPEGMKPTPAAAVTCSDAAWDAADVGCTGSMCAGAGKVCCLLCTRPSNFQPPLPFALHGDVPTNHKCTQPNVPDWANFDGGPAREFVSLLLKMMHFYRQ